MIETWPRSQGWHAPGPSSSRTGTKCKPPGKESFHYLGYGAHCGETQFRDLHGVETYAPVKVTRAGEYTHSPPPVPGGSNPVWLAGDPISMPMSSVWWPSVFKSAKSVTIQTHLNTAGATPCHLSISVLLSLEQDSRSWEEAPNWLSLGSAPMSGPPRAGISRSSTMGVGFSIPGHPG